MTGKIKPISICLAGARPQSTTAVLPHQLREAKCNTAVATLPLDVRVAASPPASVGFGEVRACIHGTDVSKDPDLDVAAGNLGDRRLPGDLLQEAGAVEDGPVRGLR
ncbi:hypothetical protein ACQR09_28995 [Bradyrhizobium oligotrophicum]|uniref:hypothetical protein n=1 Tax=Bradyrhizobium oligotrophicum TaxID=44255 RepID=UPI003EBEFA5D